MNTELQTKILQLLNSRRVNNLGPILLSALAFQLGVEARQVGNTLDSMRERHQVKHQTNKGWTITGVGVRVMNGYAPAPKTKTQPKLTQAPPATPAVAPAAPSAPAPAVVAPVAPAPVPQAPASTTHVCFVVDRSGSMSAYRAEAQNVVNNLLQQLAAKHATQPTRVSLIEFDDRIELVYQGQPAAPARNYELLPRDRTALLGAVVRAVEVLDMAMPAPTDACLVTVITDGEENASLWHLRDRLPQLIKDRQATDRWTFAFAVPTAMSKVALERYGVPSGNIQVWETTKQGAQEMGVATTRAMDSYYDDRSRGVTRSNTFFQPDLSKVGAADLAKLADIRGRCYLWTIDQEAVIQPFVEAKLGHYQPGQGYYPLTKRETIQAYKQIALVDRKTGAIYAGVEARKTLGLPDTEIKIEPGNHAGFEVFIQSTSNNRKLVRGSKLLYLK